MRILFLDDSFERYLSMKQKYPDDEIVWVQTVAAARQVLKHWHFAVVCLDHDLDEDNETDSCCLIPDIVNQKDNNLYGAMIVIHSWNPVGAEWLYQQLKESFPAVKKDPKFFVV